MHPALLKLGAPTNFGSKSAYMQHGDTHRHTRVEVHQKSPETRRLTLVARACTLQCTRSSHVRTQKLSRACARRKTLFPDAEHAQTSCWTPRRGGEEGESTWTPETPLLRNMSTICTHSQVPLYLLPPPPRLRLHAFYVHRERERERESPCVIHERAHLCSQGGSRACDNLGSGQT